MFDSLFSPRTSSDSESTLFFNDPSSSSGHRNINLDTSNGHADAQSAGPKSNIVAFFNYKGGTGKTTSCISVAGRLAQLGKRVLVIDWDPQANASLALGVEPARVPHSIAEVVQEQLNGYRGPSIKRAIIATKIANLDIASSKLQLSSIESAMLVSNSPEELLLDCLEPIRTDYDFILIDMPSGANMLISAGLRAATQLVVPCSASLYSIQALHSVRRLLNQVKKNTGHTIPYIMVAVTRSIETNRLPLVGHRRPATTESIEEQLSHMFNKVFKVPDSMDILDAQQAHVPVSHFAPSGSASKSYAEMADHVIQNADAVSALRFNLGKPAIPRSKLAFVER